MPCDTGTAREILEADEMFRGISFARCVDGWNSKQGEWAADSATLEERARRARRWLKTREESHVVAVLHGAVSFFSFFSSLYSTLSPPPLSFFVCLFVWRVGVECADFGWSFCTF